MTTPLIIDFLTKWVAIPGLCLWSLILVLRLFGINFPPFVRWFWTATLWWFVIPAAVYWVVLIICHYAQINLYLLLEHRGYDPKLFFTSPNDVMARKGLGYLCGALAFASCVNVGFSKAADELG